jgi:hypothetical protein
MVLPIATDVKKKPRGMPIQKREQPRSIRFDPELKEAIEDLAVKEDRSFNKIVNMLLKEALAFRQKAAPSETTLNHPAASPDRGARQTRNPPA